MLEHVVPPVQVRWAAGVAVTQAAGLIAYGISIIVSEQGQSTSGIAGSGADLAPGVLVGLYLVFAALVLVIARAYRRGSRAAVTPLLLVQAFAVVVAQPLLAAAGTRGLGLLVLLTALVGAALALSRPARGYFR